MCLVSSPPPQGKQWVRPGSDWYVPTGQAWQGLKPLAEKKPGEHWPGSQKSWLRGVGWGVHAAAARIWVAQALSPPGKGLRGGVWWRGQHRGRWWEAGLLVWMLLGVHFTAWLAKPGLTISISRKGWGEGASGLATELGNGGPMCAEGVSDFTSPLPWVGHSLHRGNWPVGPQVEVCQQSWARAGKEGLKGSSRTQGD